MAKHEGYYYDNEGRIRLPEPRPLYTLRAWLIQLLAGKSGVIINATIHGTAVVPGAAVLINNRMMLPQSKETS